MGIIDKTTHFFKCPRCGNKESCVVLDKGSSYSGSWWQCGPSLKKFDVSWNGGREAEPHVERAICRRCGVKADHSSEP